jgi:L-histidine N-alpha-methyltransferase
MFKYEILNSDASSFSVENQFAQAVLEGLSKKNKCLPSWLLFDNRGSEIFKEITESPEYLPAVCEFEIFNNHIKIITDLISKQPFNLIELGSGDGGKTQLLIKDIIKNKIDLTYYPIDISEGAIRDLVETLKLKHENTTIKVNGLVGDYFVGLKNLTRKKDHRNLVLFLGVTLNNMSPPDASIFLKKLHKTLNKKDLLLIGFDLMKNPKIIHNAYNDSKGLFEKFNLYLLDRINEVLGGNFEKEFFVHQGHYNPKINALESYLYSTKKQSVHIRDLNKDFKFLAWEGTKTEQSYKFNQEKINLMAKNNGFKIIKELYDSKEYFVDSIWEVV